MTGPVTLKPGTLVRGSSFSSIIKIVLIVTLSVAAIATIVVLSKCVELTREGIHIDMTPLLDIV